MAKSDPIEVKRADCGHYVTADREADYYEATERIVHKELGADLVKEKTPVVLCAYCAKQI